MPRIDLWAVETSSQEESKCSETCIQSTAERSLSSDGSEVGDKEKCCRDRNRAILEASYLWTLFIEQVESIRLSTSLIILVWIPLIVNRRMNKYSCACTRTHTHTYLSIIYRAHALFNGHMGLCLIDFELFSDTIVCAFDMLVGLFLMSFVSKLTSKCEFLLVTILLYINDLSIFVLGSRIGNKIPNATKLQKTRMKIIVISQGTPK